MLEIDIRTCPKKKKLKEYGKNTDKLCLKKTNKKGRPDCIPKSIFDNMLRKEKENNELKRVKVDLVDTFVKDEVGTIFDTKDYLY